LGVPLCVLESCLNKAFCYSAAVKSIAVKVFVCLSVSPHAYFRNNMPKPYEIFSAFTYNRGLALSGGVIML